MAFPSPKLPVDNPHGGGDTVLLADVLSQDFGAALVSRIGQSIVQDRLEAATGQMAGRRSCRTYTEAMNLAGPERLASAEREPPLQPMSSRLQPILNLATYLRRNKVHLPELYNSDSSACPYLRGASSRDRIL